LEKELSQKERKKVSKTDGKALEEAAANNSEDKLFTGQKILAIEGDPHFQTEAS
jgi:hypothetical protein